MSAELPPGAARLPRREQYLEPKRPAYFGLCVVIAFLAMLTLWSTLAPVSGAAIANGNLQVQGKRQAVQHPYGGVVRDLLVREGERVAKGQVLLTLVDSDSRAKLDVLDADRDAALAQEARLISERDDKAEPDFAAIGLGGKDKSGARQAIANERAVMAARRRQFDTETDVQRKQIDQLNEQIAGARAQRDGLATQEQLLQKEIDGAEKLLESGFAPQTRVWALHRDRAKLQADQAAQQADIARMQQQIAQTELEIAKLARTRTSDITDELRGVQSKLSELGPKIDAARDILERTSIRSPADGLVVGLDVFTEGGVIQPGAKLLDIVPTSTPLIAEARLPLAGINDVAAGQRAEVRLTAINYIERPSIYGTISTVSADRLTDDKTGQGYYALQVALNEADVAKSRIDLQAGMPLQVIVSTRPRTLLQYLVGPLKDEINGAFRER